MNNLLELIKLEIAAIRSFISLLESERATLIAGDAESLPLLAEEKTSFAARLNDLGNQRDQIFRGLGILNTPDAITMWLSSQTKDVCTAWQTLIDLAREVHELNASNGKLINTRIQRNQQALNVLLDAAALVNTYGPDGQQRIGPGSGRTLGSA